MGAYVLSGCLHVCVCVCGQRPSVITCRCVCAIWFFACACARVCAWSVTVDSGQRSSGQANSEQRDSGQRSSGQANSEQRDSGQRARWHIQANNIQDI